MVGNKAQKAVAAALTGVLAFGGVAPAFAGTWTDTTGNSWYRIDGSHEERYILGTTNSDVDNMDTPGAMRGGDIIAGENRYDTAWDAINYNYDRGLYRNTKYVVLASGESQADTLVASGVAGMLCDDQGGIDVPVMITPSDKLATQAKNVIKFFADNYANGDDFTVYIVGGEAAVSKTVESAIKKIEYTDQTTGDDENVDVERLAGENRVATSLEAARVVDDDGWLDEDFEDFQNRVYVANGKAWPDALSVSSFAYFWGQPILLTSADGKLSQEQLDYLLKLDDSVTIEVVGGPAQPSAQQLWDAGAKRARVNYMAGENRYETSAFVIADIANEWYTLGGGFVAPFAQIAVASGTEDHWADALIGGPFVGANNGVLALVDGIDEVTALKEAYKHQKNVGATDADGHALAGRNSYVMGGTAAINKKFADKLNDNFPVA